jgi:hypothetical protein
MLLVVPVKTLFMYLAIGMSSYSLFTFLLTASPLELQFMMIFTNLCSLGVGIIVVFQYIPQILDAVGTLLELSMNSKSDSKCNEDALFEDHQDAVEAEEAEEDEEMEEEAEKVYVQTSRHVEEKDGRLIITTTYEPATAEADETEEVREMVELSPPQESPTEETAEFADLLTEKKAN